MYGAALRGLFIIDTEGTIRSVTVSAVRGAGRRSRGLTNEKKKVNDDHVGRSVDEAIRLIQGFQYADKHGEVCPANWKPGDATIKPDQSEKMEYFSKAGL